MMLELTHGYPMPRKPVQVCYDGAVWFFYQEGDDEKIVMASESVDGLILWLRLAADARDEAPAVPVLEIPGGHFRGIVGQTKIVASWVKEPGSVYPAVRLSQGEDLVEFDADEAPYLATLLEIEVYFLKPRQLTESERKVYAQFGFLKAKEAMNMTYGKYGKNIKPVTLVEKTLRKEAVQAAEKALHLPRPQDALVHCPRCLAGQGKLIDCAAGQNEVRCDVCDFVFQFRYTPDMTEGT
jgi:hypothetical protein